ncbi:MAG TPA: group III truncated hemoglobin [Ferrovibrio sp.]|uniref:group III truncated hemoglobin n=1 Tax=Ferrovibrio sp. TaxID=1917215 RepID=UPI002ED1A991
MQDRAAQPQVDEAMVEALVRRFYDRVKADRLLGPLFRMAIADWDGHLKVVADFWSRVLLGSDRYRGCVMGAHGGLMMKPAHFDRWLALFKVSAEETLPPAALERVLDAAIFVDRRLRAIHARQPRRA